MFRHWAHILLAATAGASQSACMAPTDADCAIAASVADEHAVIAAALLYNPGGGPATDGPFVVIRSTGPSYAESEDFRRTIDLSEEPPPPPSVVIDDMIRRSDDPIDVDPSLLDVDPHPLTMVEESAVPINADRRGEEWATFESEYGTSSAIQLSRPGIGCHEAVVAHVQWCGDLCATAVWYVIEKDDDDLWTAVAVINAWIS
jgi:hypothetical protein